MYVATYGVPSYEMKCNIQLALAKETGERNWIWISRLQGCRVCDSGRRAKGEEGKGRKARAPASAAAAAFGRKGERERKQERKARVLRCVRMVTK
jgi:hypothetical protein